MKVGFTVPDTTGGMGESPKKRKLVEWKSLYSLVAGATRV